MPTEEFTRKEIIDKNVSLQRQNLDLHLRDAKRRLEEKEREMRKERYIQTLLRYFGAFGLVLLPLAILELLGKEATRIMIVGLVAGASSFAFGNKLHANEECERLRNKVRELKTKL